MTDKSRLWAIVPAAGRGARFGSELPKQYLQLADKTVIEHSIAKLLAISDIVTVVVALHPEDTFFDSLACANDPRVSRVDGGLERSDSVACALQSLNAEDTDWVLVHDAARPCVSHHDITQLIERGCAHQVGAILAVPVVDTIKRSTEDGEIQKTVDRERMWRALTPQLFRYGALTKALTYCREHQLKITDEASAMEHCGDKPALIAGSHRNIKITYPDDLAIAEVFLSRGGQ
ncbi:2-C-methyl-D-erythritol 4-phosphate cytidylyltransferase [Zhongshania aliphaticivorans]|uniref:2-C-methyl-D-erythritol 4-phosphate cytidylyltransferase n=1 Tax=Zhongshania aliphaticivorans TaxID=1470434 RepID=A0A5S9NJX4_9GAMM|nr:2-C-methyl-D-erythritol 4-phosphate cytidylyltransferase [Zhongshania aliphaticivorans]CAA0090131.1 2-C-methyl-D-erythritol 4-phosphate cytidylyltransferase [Zhongshania aliphaticivorans]CAA0097464.1 2-C-methyl-D-erythritol 4-phosphate cytidylyltransferase [Zhongshania aliphaticivorans]